MVADALHLEPLVNALVNAAGDDCRFELEAPPGFEPGIEVLQTSALPLGDGAGRNCVQGDSGRVYARQQQHAEQQVGTIIE